MTRALWIVIVGGLLLGCSRGTAAPETADTKPTANPYDRLVGKWADKPKDARIALELAPDRSFQATFIIKSSPAIVKGKADFDGANLTLSPVQFNGREPKDPSEQMKAKFAFEESTMSLKSTDGPALYKRP